MARAAVVYDDFRDGPSYEFTVIKNNRGNLTIIPIPATDENGNPKTSSAIRSDITSKTSSGDGLIVTACTVTGLLREDIGWAAKQNNLIAICPDRMYVERTTNRCLMSYGPDLKQLYARAVTNYIKPIVAGAPLPDEEVNPLGYELVINSTIANALGITPQPLTITQMKTITPATVP